MGVSPIRRDSDVFVSGLYPQPLCLGGVLQCYSGLEDPGRTKYSTIHRRVDPNGLFCPTGQVKLTGYY